MSGVIRKVTCPDSSLCFPESSLPAGNILNCASCCGGPACSLSLSLTMEEAPSSPKSLSNVERKKKKGQGLQNLAKTEQLSDLRKERKVNSYGRGSLDGKKKLHPWRNEVCGLGGWADVREVGGQRNRGEKTNTHQNQ